jgi:hypothetical protein
MSAAEKKMPCPACRETGHDKTGNHLTVFPSGKFACAVHPRDKTHNRRILELRPELGKENALPSPEPARKDDDAARKRASWPAFETGSRCDFLTVSNLRGIAIEGIELASERGLLCFADWRNFPCWIVTDSCRMNAQARRMDGLPFVVEGESRKAITLPGSRAGSPIGLSEARDFPAVAVCEGGPDLLAAHGCMWAEGRQDVAAVAMLGAGHRPSVAAWSALAGKRVRIYCHRDTHGMKAGQEWGQAILAAGVAKIDGFRFDGLRKVDESPVTDLNDLLALHPDDFEARRDVWEILP